MPRNKSDENKLSYPELLDIPQVTLSEAREQVMLSLEAKQRRGCIVLVGESGLGKTQIFDQIARETEYKVRKIHTAHWGLMGSGIPRKAEGEFFDVAVPSIFPRKGEKSILLFDELNRGLKHAIAMFFTMLEDGTMFNYTLPDECLVVGTMNPATAQYAVTSIENEPAIRRRVKFLYVIPNNAGFLSHAASDKFHAGSTGPAKGRACHPGILGFFRSNPQHIYDMKAKDADKQYCNPAGIETLSEDAWNMSELTNYDLYGEFALTRYGASIGVTMASQIAEYLKDSSVLLKPEDVLYRFSKVEKGIRKMIKKALHEPLADLCNAVLLLLFTDKHELKKTSKNFLKFCTVLPEEMAANMLFQMKETADQGGSTNFLNDLMCELQDYEEWIKLQLTIDKNHRKVDEGIRSS